MVGAVFLFILFSHECGSIRFEINDRSGQFAGVNGTVNVETALEQISNSNNIHEGQVDAEEVHASQDEEQVYEELHESQDELAEDRDDESYEWREDGDDEEEDPSLLETGSVMDAEGAEESNTLPTIELSKFLQKLMVPVMKPVTKKVMVMKKVMVPVPPPREQVDACKCVKRLSTHLETDVIAFNGISSTSKGCLYKGSEETKSCKVAKGAVMRMLMTYWKMKVCLRSWRQVTTKRSGFAEGEIEGAMALVDQEIEAFNGAANAAVSKQRKRLMPGYRCKTPNPIGARTKRCQELVDLTDGAKTKAGWTPQDKSEKS